MTEASASLASWHPRGDAAAVADKIAGVVARLGLKRIAVPGGSTPTRIFAMLAQRGLDWHGTTLVLTDDRQVPVDHPASNMGSLKASMGETGATLVGLESGAPVAPFDLVWLGMGTDGHVASLFPTMAAENVLEPTVISTLPNPLPPEAPFARLSLNIPALVACDELILVVTGQVKKDVLERALAGTIDVPVARLLRAACCPITIYWSE
jgi:6-phosphogluconolactonase